MKITIESTSRIIQLVTPGGTVPARVWKGSTEHGVPCFCFVTRISPAIPIEQQLTADDVAEFERDLKEQRAPSPAVARLDSRYVL